MSDDTYQFSATDFAFHVGRDNNPGIWDTAPAPTLITTRSGDGVGNSVRVNVLWDDGLIKNTWLQVTVLANENTGIFEHDVFYFGNAVGDTGNDPTSTLVNAADVIAIRDNPRRAGNTAGIDNPYDINRDRSVDALDIILARNNATSPLSALRLITPSAASPAPVTPAGEGESKLPIGSSASAGTPSLQLLDTLMAAKTDHAVDDAPVTSATLSKLLRRLGSTGN